MGWGKGEGGKREYVCMGGRRKRVGEELKM